MNQEKLQKLRNEKIRITGLLTAILGILGRAKKPMTITDLTGALKKKSFLPNKTTLYRQMEKLTSVGLLQENIFSDSLKRYCLTEEGIHHHHFYCKKCGRAESLPPSLCGEITAVENYFKRKKFKIFRHNLEIEGLCPNCHNV